MRRGREKSSENMGLCLFNYFACVFFLTVRLYKQGHGF